MSEREHGPLSDPTRQNDNRAANKKAVDVIKGDLRELAASPAFRRWWGRFGVPVIRMTLNTNNGGDLQHFNGRRALVNDMLRDVESVEPMFLELVLSARRNFEQAINLRDEQDKET